MPRIASDFVEVCVYRMRNASPEFLLLRRSDDEPLYPALWQHVTGTIMEGEGAIDAAHRELFEETGLRAVRFWVVPFVNTFYAPSKDTIQCTPFFAAEVSSLVDPCLSSEHSAYAWLLIDEARERLVWPGQKTGLELVLKEILGGRAAAPHLS